ncbi:hypothetical protein EDB82DRAFT_494522, partial [Fusarium venenatum]|uniref:uncharacterized protein n=1 Tax=Fusarium venenatum TaxID=56646 RepID=UPI001D412BF9
MCSASCLSVVCVLILESIGDLSKIKIREAKRICTLAPLHLAFNLALASRYATTAVQIYPDLHFSVSIETCEWIL